MIPKRSPSNIFWTPTVHRPFKPSPHNETRWFTIQWASSVPHLGSVFFLKHYGNYVKREFYGPWSSLVSCTTLFPTSWVSNQAPWGLPRSVLFASRPPDWTQSLLSEILGFIFAGQIWKIVLRLVLPGHIDWAIGACPHRCLKK
jgi:hypothetical protein